MNYLKLLCFICLKNNKDLHKKSHSIYENYESKASIQHKITLCAYVVNKNLVQLCENIEKLCETKSNKFSLYQNRDNPFYRI